jgi:hypothetical protein
MERDRDSLDYELMGEDYYAALDAEREARERDERDEDDDAEAEAEAGQEARYETTAAILAHAARIGRARAEMAAELAELAEMEEKEAA